MFTFDANSYLVVSIPLAFELVSRVTRGEPLLGVSIRLDMSTLSELCAKMNISKRASAVDQKSAQASPMDYVINEATLRLLECLRSPLDSAILGPGIVREILYRVLCGKQSGMLCALLGVHGQLAQVNSVLQRLHSTFTEPLDVSKLAREAGISISALHHNFKAVTATSPLRYVKALRLHKARLLILHDGMRAAAAAESVGYESASQFSREFKRHFGKTPKHQIEVSRGRAFISLGSAMVP